MFTFLNIFTSFFTWSTALGERLKNYDEFLDYYKNYFQDTSVCGNVLLVALIISLLLALVYYLVCGNLFFSFGKRYVWLILLCICFFLTMFITPYTILGNYDQAGLYSGNNNTRLFWSAKNTLENKLIDVEDDEGRNDIIFTADEYAGKFVPTGNKTAAIGMFLMKESIPLEMSLMNGIYSVLLFFLWSMCFKRYSTHCKSIPF